MYESFKIFLDHIAVYFSNPVSFTIIVVGAAAILIHITVPVVLGVWGLVWGFLDDNETPRQNWYLDLWRTLRKDVVKEADGKFYVADNCYYINEHGNQRRFSSCTYAEMFAKKFDTRSEAECAARHNERFFDQVYVPVLFITAVMVGVAYILTNFLLYWTALVAALVGLAFTARAVRRLQKKAKSTLEEIRAHKADPDAHKARSNTN